MQRPRAGACSRFALLAVAAVSTLCVACGHATGVGSGPPQAMRASGDWVVVDTVRLQRQRTRVDCGPRSLAMVVQRWGLDQAPALAIDPGSAGATAGQLRDQTRRMGLKAFVFAGRIRTADWFNMLVIRFVLSLFVFVSCRAFAPDWLTIHRFLQRSRGEVTKDVKVLGLIQAPFGSVLNLDCAEKPRSHFFHQRPGFRGLGARHSSLRSFLPINCHWTSSPPRISSAAATGRGILT